jgi:hypothetical protein
MGGLKGGIWLCLFTVSFSVLVRPMKNIRAAARPSTNMAPTTIPAIAPGDKALLCDLPLALPEVGPAVAVVVVALDVNVDDAGLSLAAASGGKSSPGCITNFALEARSFCVAKTVVAFLEYVSALSCIASQSLLNSRVDDSNHMVIYTRSGRRAIE